MVGHGITECRHISKRTNGLSVLTTANCFTTIFYHLQAINFSNHHDGFHICGQPEEMNRYNAASTTGDLVDDLLRVHIESQRIDVYEYRRHIVLYYHI